MSLIQHNTKYIYSIGEQIYDIYKKKSGIVKYLRNDSHEKSTRQYDPTHYYYFIEYDDGDFDTYVSVKNFILREEKYNNKINKNIKYNEPIDSIDSGLMFDDYSFDYKNFLQGQRFRCISSKKFGTVRNLRNDSREIFMRQSDSKHYYYHVDFDDGTFETYIHGMYLQPM